MTPTEKYLADLQSSVISDDPEQRRILALLDELQQDIERSGTVSGGLLNRWLGLGRGGTEKVQGLYLWGGVGRGKTYLMDLFYETLGEKRKLRTHFHRFMHRVHQDLARHQGSKDPLQLIADEIADQARVLCFDEFFVLDIGDAMILAGLLEALFSRGLVLVTTSNIHPDGLYKDGLQRQRFLPAIELIKANTRVVAMADGTDYRLRVLSQASLYHSPLTEQTDALLEQCFAGIATDKLDWQSNCKIEILGRQIPARLCAGDAVWFEFPAICDSPRSAFDYVEIARLFHSVIVSNVPAMADQHNDQVRRFINLVDALYDRQVKLILSAEVEIDRLYSGETLAFEFERTRSRLVEMQSQDYLGASHGG